MPSERDRPPSAAAAPAATTPLSSPEAAAYSDSASRLQSLAVPGFEPAVLFVPSGNAQRPLVLATHGAGGAPEWECDYWRQLTRDRAFVLCLRGKPLRPGSTGFYYPDHHALERELVAAERAARAAQPRILPVSGIYAGFSQGASMGAFILPSHVASFPYVVLIEGFTTFSLPLARRFHEAGGKRIVFACGSKQCASVAATSARFVETVGAGAHLAIAPGAGHTPAGAVMDQVAAALPWLLEGDPNWSALF